jgi:hypothetical protein
VRCRFMPRAMTTTKQIASRKLESIKEIKEGTS